MGRQQLRRIVVLSDEVRSSVRSGLCSSAQCSNVEASGFKITTSAAATLQIVEGLVVYRDAGELSAGGSREQKNSVRI
ncbi:unnamed protein product [Sphagnum tenellum]